VDVENQMSAYALRDLDRRDYARRAWWNIGSYFFLPANFVRHLTPLEGRGTAGLVGQYALLGVTYVYYLPLLLTMLISMVRIQVRSLEAQILDTLTKIALLALFVQPLVHVAGSRYWTTAGPLFMIAAAGFVREISLRHSGQAVVRERLNSRDDALSRWLRTIQYILAGTFGAVLVVLGVLAI